MKDQWQKHKSEAHDQNCKNCNLKFVGKFELVHHIDNIHTTDEVEVGEISMEPYGISGNPTKTENPEGNKTPESDNDDKNGEVSIKFEVKSDSPAKTENGEVSMESEEDKVDKAEAPVGKEKTEDSKQNTPLKKPIPKDEDLPTSAVIISFKDATIVSFKDALTGNTRTDGPNTNHNETPSGHDPPSTTEPSSVV